MDVFTHVEYLKTAVLRPLVRAVVKKFVETSMVLQVLPFVPTQGPAATFWRQSALPRPHKRAIGEPWQESEGRLDPGIEFLKIAGGLSSFDDAQRRMGQGWRRSLEVEGFVEAIALDFDRDLIKGDQDADPREYNGLQKRLQGPQVVAADPVGGTLKPLSVVQALKCKRRVSRPTHWLFGEAMADWITVMAMDTSVGGHITRSKNEMGEEVTIFCGLPILVLKTDSTETPILDFNEAVTAGGTNGASGYCVSLRRDRLHGIHPDWVEAVDLGLDPTGTKWNTSITWLVNFVPAHERSACRLRDLANAKPTLEVN